MQFRTWVERPCSAGGACPEFLEQVSRKIVEASDSRLLLEDYRTWSLEAALWRFAYKGLANGCANVLETCCCRFARTLSGSAFQPYG
jgi:hypothetical protein